MKTLVLLAHPNIAQSHTNKTWLEALKNSNQNVEVHDIYSKYPDWKFNVTEEQDLLTKYDRIILQYPFQWYNMPPLLKKWMDDVLQQGWAYGEGGNYMQGKEIGVAVTTAGVKDVYDESHFGTVEQLLRPMESTVKFIGSKYIGYHAFLGAYTPDAGDRLTKDTDAYVEFVTK